VVVLVVTTTVSESLWFGGPISVFYGNPQRTYRTPAFGLRSPPTPRKALRRHHRRLFITPTVFSSGTSASAAASGVSPTYVGPQNFSRLLFYIYYIRISPYPRKPVRESSSSRARVSYKSMNCHSLTLSLVILSSGRRVRWPHRML
jgi:hypothetical protein